MVRKHPGKLRGYTEAEAVAVLEELARRWPETLWLFSASGGLNVMKKNDNGERAMETTSKQSVYDQKYVIAKIDIENDGGDW